MPNISIQYSSNMGGIDFRSILTRVHSLLVEHCDAKPMACKGTIECADEFVIGDGSDASQGFVLIHIALLSGRTDEQKERLRNALTDLAAQELSTSKEITCQVRLKLEELTRDKQYFFLAN